MAELAEKAVLGAHIIWKVRPFSKQSLQSASKLALQVDGDLSGSVSINRKATKETTITSRGSNEFTVDLNYVASRDVVNQEIYDTFLKREELELWRIDTGAPGTTEGKYKATYVRGFVESWNLPDNVDDTVDSSTSVAVTYGPADGEVTLTAAEMNEIIAAFSFVDTEPVV